MEEEVTQKTIALAIKTTKLTSDVLRKSLQKFLTAQRQKQRTPYKRGKQTYRQLKKPGVSLFHIEITDDNIKDFDKAARYYKVDYCVKKAENGNPPTYYVFFRGPDSDTINLAFKKFVNQKMVKKDKPSIMGQLEHFKEILVKRKNRERSREHTKDRGHSL